MRNFFHIRPLPKEYRYSYSKQDKGKQHKGRNYRARLEFSILVKGFLHGRIIA
jgi:hypothetical protein